jgi:hypothetical protein
MKTIIIISAVLMMMTAVNGQESDTTKKTLYAVELSQSITGSGFPTGTELYLTVLHSSRKALSFGLYFSPTTKKLTGVTIHHEMALTKKTSRTVVPFAFYNLIYRFTKVNVSVEENGEEYTHRALYKSLEHHIGAGVQIRTFKNIYVKTEAGYGVYFGSIKNNTTIDPVTGKMAGGNGFCPIAKIGITYVF